MVKWLAAVTFGLAMLASSAPSSSAQTNPGVAARVAQVAPAFQPDDAFMGSVLVVDGGRTVVDRGYGYANLDWKIPNAPDVRFRVGSITKQFTAALILLLQEDGRLNIADPVIRYVPSAPASWKGITLAQLLGHVSGIADFTDDPSFRTWSASPHTQVEELAFIEAKPLDFAPGSRFSYSNSNYEVLGAVIEKVTGRTYADVLRERILEPLGMRDTGLDTDELILPKRALGYQQRSGGGGLDQARSESLTVPWAAGSLYSTTHDLLRWQQALFGGKVLTPRSFALMTTPGQGHYALGLDVRTVDGVTLVSHSGGIEGFSAYLASVPERRLTIVVLGNVASSAPQVIGRALLDVISGRPIILPNERRPVPMPAGDLQAFAGSYAAIGSPDLEVAVVGDHLTVQSKGGQARDMIYQGRKDAHAWFYVPSRFYDLEFVSDRGSPPTAMILHAAADERRYDRR